MAARRALNAGPIGGDPRRRTPQGELKAPKFVRFHPLDNGDGCDEIFWEDPLTFTPRRGRNFYIDSWGIYPVAQLRQLDLGDLPKRDYTLYISLPHIDNPVDSRFDRYWRRIRISGGMPLGVFADKVITPLWGWVRNLHAHVFHDFKDGALFGPKDCNAVDIMHLDKSGYAYIPEESYCVAHVLQNPGDVMGYHYDFGDNWWVDIKLEEIAPVEESSGAVVVLDGAGGIPPDGEQTGTFNWAEYLRTAAVSPVGKRIAVEALFGATNYIQAGRQLLVDPLEYDFGLLLASYHHLGDFPTVVANRSRLRT
ncbi:MM3350-like domain-containing protein [Earliella scabrosa]|nr:MM3350-like domain-containing protein [Earliella scabrosa]